MLNREQKKNVVDELVNNFSTFSSFYIVDPMGLASGDVSEVRRDCFNQDVKYKLAKNTLILKALEKINPSVNIEEFAHVLKGSSAIFFINEDKLSFPAKLIKSKIKKSKSFPMKLKAAYIEGEMYSGEKYLEMLSALLSKNEILGSIVGSLKGKLSMIVKSLQDSKRD